MEWQPISTAPKDGSTILVFGVPEKHPSLESGFTGPVQVTAHWDMIDEAFCITGGDWLGPFIKPTHWMPTPPAPKGVE